jgi:hypothetical protein
MDCLSLRDNQHQNNINFMRYLILIILGISLSQSVEAQSTRFGFGYLGSSVSGVIMNGVTLGWTAHDWRLEATLAAYYSTNGLGTYSSSIDKAATFGLGYFWIDSVEKNLSIVFGPRVLFSGYKQSSSYSYSNDGNIISSTNDVSYYTTSLILEAGPEYALNTHFSIGVAFAPYVSLRGQANYGPSSNSPTGTGMNYSLGGNISARYYF